MYRPFTLLLTTLLFNQAQTGTEKVTHEVTLTEGEMGKFPCGPFRYHGPSGQIYTTNRKYLCRDPCRHNDVLVATNSPKVGRIVLNANLDDNGAEVVILDVQATDAGTYWCAIDLPHQMDNYQRIVITVILPEIDHD